MPLPLELKLEIVLSYIIHKPNLFQITKFALKRGLSFFVNCFWNLEHSAIGYIKTSGKRIDYLFKSF